MLVEKVPTEKVLEDEVLEEEVPAEKVLEYIPWKAARELGELSYQMALKREQIIDDKFGKIMTFISLIIGAITFLFNSRMADVNQTVSIYLLVKLNIELKVVFAIIIFLLFIILLLTAVGQYGFKKEYIATAQVLLETFKKEEQSYSDINSLNFVFVDQYEKVHKSLNKVLDRKSKLLDIIQFIEFTVIIIVGFTFVGLILK